VTSKSGLEHTASPDQSGVEPQPDDSVIQKPNNFDVADQMSTDGIKLYTIDAAPDEPHDGIIIDVGFDAMSRDEQLSSSALMSRSSMRVEFVPMRAMVVTGTILSLMVAASSILWALYKFKPGLLTSSSQSLPFDSMIAEKAPGTGSASDTSLAPVVMGNGIVHRISRTSAFHHNAASQTILSESSAGNVWDGFVMLSTSAYLTPAGSGVAGLVATDRAVTRGTQTEFVTVGLGCPSIRLSIGI
jgi:hypothetical protein